MGIVEYKDLDPLQALHLTQVALDFALKPEMVAHIHESDPGSSNKGGRSIGYFVLTLRHPQGRGSPGNGSLACVWQAPDILAGMR